MKQPNVLTQKIQLFHTHRVSYFQTELRSVGYLLRFFSSSSRASWMHSLVETLV